MPPSAPSRLRLVGLQPYKRAAAFAADVAAGLAGVPKQLPCCYFYDALGSALFEAICRLPEYYLTRAEDEILRAHVEEIAAFFSSPTDLVELGSGSAAKTRLLIEAFLRRHGRQRYIPVDICRTVLEGSSLELINAYPDLSILAIAGEYQEALVRLGADGGRRKLILWLGSNIGNLERGEAARFLGRLRATMTADDRILVGIDLRKNRAVLEAAYDDACGVTAAFNRNILARINRDLGGHFDLRTFQHRAVYNQDIGRIEMYLVSDRAQKVSIDRPGIEVSFAAGEPIHTENSYKYSSAEIDTLAAGAGLYPERTWLDNKGRFSTNLLAAH